MIGLFMVNHFGSFSNQVDGLHQQIVVKVLVNFEQKVETDFAKGKGNDQSGKVENKVFECLCIFNINLHMIEGHKVRTRIVISEVCFTMSQFFCVNELMGFSRNVVKCNILYFLVFIPIFEAKDPHFSEVNEISMILPTFILHL